MNLIKTEILKHRLLLTMAILLIVLSACLQQETILEKTITPTSPVTPIEPTSISTTLSSTPQDEITESTITETETAPIPTSSVEIEEVLGQSLLSDVDWFIIIEDNQGEILFSKNPDKSFAPASMIKIPTAMSVLKILEEQGKNLTDIQTYGISGRNFSNLLSAMVVNSEEKATEALEFFARGDNRLPDILNDWGLTHTTYDPRQSTARDLLLSLKLLKTNQALNQDFSQFLLDQMLIYTNNDDILLGKLRNTLPDCQFFNKRGTMLNPTIVADMGILSCGNSYWYLVIAGTPAPDSSATFEDIQSSLENFANAFGTYVQVQLGDKIVDE